MIVFTAGVFDFFHIGHFNMLKKCSLLGSQLIVGIHTDKKRTKGVEYFYTIEERMEIIKSLRFVNSCIPYENIDELVKTIRFDIFAYGPDQNNIRCQSAKEYCIDKNLCLVEIDRTPGVSSTEIRKYIDKTGEWM